MAEQHYFGSLAGKTIKTVRTLSKIEMEDLAWDGYDQRETIALIFTDGTFAVVMQDPEGNGPGWLETGDLA
jgi:TRAP-type C4-dicarboxylate transport system permease large subunit